MSSATAARSWAWVVSGSRARASAAPRRSAAGALWAGTRATVGALMGLAPHVMHHIGLLAGAALASPPVHAQVDPGRMVDAFERAGGIPVDEPALVAGLQAGFLCGPAWLHAGSGITVLDCGCGRPLAYR